MRASLRTNLNNKYFSLFMDIFEWKGIDKEASDYIGRRLWTDGTVAAWPIPRVNEVGFSQYATQYYNMYDLPNAVLLINKWQVPFMPKGPQIVNQDVVLGWIFTNHKPVKMAIDHYVDRIVQVEMVINTNLQVHKMPFVVGITPEDKEKARDILDRILNDEVAVFMDAEDLNLIKSFATATPYIIDKLYNYKKNLETELLTILGIDNAMIDSTQDRQLLDAVNANNSIITLSQIGMLENLKDFCQRIKEHLNVEISVEPRLKPVNSVHEEINDVGEKDDNIQLE